MKAISRRALLLALAGLAAAGVATGVALARSTPPLIGTGVVVIETNLGYQDGAAAGTGIVLSRSGRILTNNHVIRGATTVKVVVPGTQHSYTARVVGYDVSDDVAVLQANGAANLKTAALEGFEPGGRPGGHRARQRRWNRHAHIRPWPDHRDRQVDPGRRRPGQRRAACRA